MKILYENKQLNEGPGAGYTVSGTLNNVRVYKIESINKNNNNAGLIEYEIFVDAEADFVDVNAGSYYYSGSVRKTPVTIEAITAEFEDGELTPEDIKWAIEGAKIEAILGGGWSHSTFDGRIDVDYKGIENAYNLLAIGFNLLDDRAIEYLDRAVQGENTEESYTVVDEDDTWEASFESAQEAIEYAQKYNYPKVLHIMIREEEFEGYSEVLNQETVWEADDVEESLSEGATSISDEDLNDMAKFLDKFFAKQKINDITIDVRKGHLYAKDSDGNRWKDGQLYGFILKEVLTFDEDGNLASGLGAAESFVDRLKKDASKFGVTVGGALSESADGGKRIGKDAKKHLSWIMTTAKDMFSGNNLEYATVEEIDSLIKNLTDFRNAIDERKDFSESAQPLKESFDDEERITALAEYLGIDPSEIHNTYDYEYETPEGDYLVVDEDEAWELAREDIESIVDDIGLESFTEGFRDWIIMNALETDWFERAVEESMWAYAEDIKEESDDVYDNRLIAEMLELGCIDEEDIEDPDFDVDWHMDDFVSCLVDNAGDPVEYCADNFGWDWVAEAAEENSLLDMELIVEECIAQDGIAHFIARYDGEEHDLGDGLYAYRTN